jgi:hypothetical protein
MWFKSEVNPRAAAGAKLMKTPVFKGISGAVLRRFPVLCCIAAGERTGI